MRRYCKNGGLLKTISSIHTHRIGITTYEGEKTLFTHTFDEGKTKKMSTRSFQIIGALMK